MLCPIKVKSNIIELTVHTSCYCTFDLICVSILENEPLVQPCSSLYPDSPKFDFGGSTIKKG